MRPLFQILVGDKHWMLATSRRDESNLAMLLNRAQLRRRVENTTGKNIAFCAGNSDPNRLWPLVGNPWPTIVNHDLESSGYSGWKHPLSFGWVRHFIACECRLTQRSATGASRR